MSIPRPEHPRPQLRRENWVNLNGEWSCRISNLRRPDSEGPPAGADEGFAETILVPFAPESSLSGIGHRDFIAQMWYQREIVVPEVWTGDRVLLHFGAVFHTTNIYIDGVRVGRHVGGSVSFTLDITAYVQPGRSHSLVVGASSDLWSGDQPSGKQSWKFSSHNCYYSRTTGIWQTVWLEAVHPLGLRGVHIVGDVYTGAFICTPTFVRSSRSGSLQIVVSQEGSEVARAVVATANGIPVPVTIPNPQLWEPGAPTLYDMEFQVLDGADRELDTVQCYSGLRSVQVDGCSFLLNGQPLYQRLVLDQGFYPDSNWTAPSDSALKRDIQLGMAAGFNGARLHQKVFEERYLYWADKLGYLVWAESASWGLDYCRDGMPHRNFLSEWREVVMRDRNHPSIVAWTPLNETWEYRDPGNHRRLHEDVYALSKALDPTRPVNDSSGYIHQITDLYTVHTYTQDPTELRRQLLSGTDGQPYRRFPELDAPYQGQPYLIDEFGGIKWDPATQDDAGLAHGQNPASWGYGRAPRSLEEFYARLQGQVRTLMELDHVAGWCYTQLTDVEQEQNGVYYYDRSEKFDMERIRAIIRTTKAASNAKEP